MVPLNSIPAKDIKVKFNIAGRLKSQPYVLAVRARNGEI